jgi:hypothetical protein
VAKWSERWWKSREMLTEEPEVEKVPEIQWRACSRSGRVYFFGAPSRYDAHIKAVGYFRELLATLEEVQ